MRAITLVQPWAWGVIHGPKRIENRSWRTSYRGRILIHAGRSVNDVGWAFLPAPEPRLLPQGCLIGSVEIYDVVPLDAVRDDPLAFGPYCWLLRDPRPLPRPIPWRGRPGIFEVPEEIIPSF